MFYLLDVVGSQRTQTNRDFGAPAPNLSAKDLVPLACLQRWCSRSLSPPEDKAAKDEQLSFGPPSAARFCAQNANIGCRGTGPGRAA
ncbi:hypothetical protein PsYK624_129880 [Phanerochaete sordida]|uniref:Uncharacterized protein n=1 Tax=Phanerochaete sordida TaxID=48140 RepID=A0A9P3GKA3_9APHY|nr:hypothetical protein PsYK624_129880 [Phanerochaete sordida]